jgi:RNA polymerase sigma-70 factor (ECF subfamily)
LDDAGLIEHAKRGDLDAFGALVRRHQEFAVGAAYLVSGDLAEAEDAAQQAFIKAYYARDRLRPGVSFRPWLLRIVVNEARNLRKAAQRRSDREARASQRFPTESVAPSAEDTALASEEQRLLLAALLRLREGDRLVIGYRYLFDLSEAEMARALGLTRGTVKSRLSRALGRLRERFRDLYPLAIPAPELSGFVEERLGDLATHLPYQSVGDLADAVLGRVAADWQSPSQPTWRTPSLALGSLGLVALALVLLTIAVLAPLRLAERPSPPAATVAGQKVIVYGSDLTEAERQEVAQLLGADEALEAETVSREELVATLQAVGLPVVPADEALSSAVLTCLEPDQGLRVSTRHITRIPAAAYAHALLTARPISASLVTGAPSNRPVTGEAALVGVLKMGSYCNGGKDANADRVRLAYEQFRVIAALASESNDLTKAAAVMVKAAQAVITGRAVDEVAIGAALDHAAAAEGVTISSAQHSEVVSVLRKLGDLDYGAYAKTYHFRWISPDHVEVVPADGGGGKY